jgi:hypothetical protein
MPAQAVRACAAHPDFPQFPGARHYIGDIGALALPKVPPHDNNDNRKKPAHSH